MIRELTSINLDDLQSSLELAPWLKPLGRAALRPLARALATRLAQFDDLIAAIGLRAASDRLRPAFMRDFQVRGASVVPPTGPVLLVSNHPGLTDTLCLFSAIPRADLQILAADRPFLRALPNAAQGLIFVLPDRRAAVAAIREAQAKLQGGAAILTFPAGHIEPDPAHHPAEAARLAGWSDSTSLFARLVPGCPVVPVRVSGVVARGAESNWLTLARRNLDARGRLAAALQIVANLVWPRLWPITPMVEFLPPIQGEELREALAAGQLNDLLRSRFATPVPDSRRN